jgi:hypothetical protein
MNGKKRPLAISNETVKEVELTRRTLIYLQRTLQSNCSPLQSRNFSHTLVKRDSKPDTGRFTNMPISDRYLSHVVNNNCSPVTEGANKTGTAYRKMAQQINCT